MKATPFLRSINLQLDAADPSRFLHFQPTSKSADLIEAVLHEDGERALLVVAPYGSGKSLTAGYLLHAIQNEHERFAGAQELLKTVADRLCEVRPDLGRRMRRRASDSERRGVVATLYGHAGPTVPSIQLALREALKRVGMGREARSLEKVDSSDPSAAARLLSITTGKLKAAGRDNLLIVWDEFGRHLEGLVEQGQAGDLLNLQVLAEAATRSSELKITILLLLHRSFSGYTAALPSATRREWSKIEGRFEVRQFVDDSAEAYRLLATVVDQQRPDRRDVPIDRLSKLARDGGIFDDSPDTRELLRLAYPLEPVTLWLLPRVSARVAQNERTAFSFLAQNDLSEPVDPPQLYDYFRSEFRSDTEPGGTHKAWLEAESSLSKVDADSTEARALKTAFLLNLGLAGEQNRTAYRQLESAVRGLTQRPAEVKRALRALLESRLLIHRKHSDHVLVWHGTDVDLRGRLRDERQSRSDDFDVVSFLSRELPPPIWRPTRHNAETGVPRYFTSRFASLAGLVALNDELNLGLREPGTDGEVLYVLPSGPKDRQEAVLLASQLADPRVIVAIAQVTTDLRDRALDLSALLDMYRDPDLLAQDPLVKTELDQLTDDVRTALTRTLGQVLEPGTKSAEWFHGGHSVKLESGVTLRRYLSRTMDQVFSSTPEIRSEMVVRRRPTPVIINARKKVVLGVLERLGQPNLGIEGDFADNAVFRAVLLNTGLYREDPHPRLVRPEELRDPGMAAVWDEVRRFLTEPKELVRFQALFDTLKEPPYGLREGVLPIMLAAGLRAFPAAIAIRSKGAYVTDILPSVIEDIVRTPSDFTLTVLGLSKQEKSFLLKLREEFSTALVPTETIEGDLIRSVFDALQLWWASLPDAALTTNRLSRAAQALRQILRSDDPATSLLGDLPTAFGGEERSLERTLDTTLTAKHELAEVHQAFVREAKGALTHALRLRGLAVSDDSVRIAAKEWGNLFPPDQRLAGLNPIEKGLISQMRREHDSDESLLGALSILLTGKGFRSWDDTVVPEFERRLKSGLDDVEHVALSSLVEEYAEDADALKSGMVRLASARLSKLYGDLVRLIGPDEATRQIREIVAERATPAEPGRG